MERWAEHLSALGKVKRFDYPYMLEGRKAPDRQPKLVAAHHAALKLARKGHRGPVVLIGKSMGSRMGCHLSVEEDVKVDALVCLGYPLKGMGKSAKLRDEVLKQLTHPVLFVQGTRDNLCPLDLLKKTQLEMTAPNELYVVEAGNHSLEVTKAQLKQDGETQADVEARCVEAIGAFLQQHL